MTVPNGLPYVGALDAVRRIELALTERDAARAASESEVDAAHAEAERLLSAARAAGLRAGQQRRAALLARADTDARAVRSRGDARARRLGRLVAEERDVLAAELTTLLLPEEP